jgi:hypothetical protein
MDNPFESFLTGVQGSKLNPANWGSPGTTEYKTRRAQSEALKARMALLMETEKRKIANPSYQSPSNVKTQNAAFIRDLVANEASPEARAMLNVLARDPTMQELNEKIKAEALAGRKQANLDRKAAELKFRMENPKFMRASDLRRHLAETGLPFKTRDKGMKTDEMLARWQQVVQLRDEEGMDMADIMRMYPNWFFKKKGRTGVRRRATTTTRDDETGDDETGEAEAGDAETSEAEAGDAEEDVPEQIHPDIRYVQGGSRKGKPNITDMKRFLRENGVDFDRATSSDELEALVRDRLDNPPLEDMGDESLAETSADEPAVTEDTSDGESDEDRSARNVSTVMDALQGFGVDSNESADVAGLAIDDPNITATKNGSLKIKGADGKSVTLNKKTLAAIAENPITGVDNPDYTKSRSEALVDALTASGAWATMSNAAKGNVQNSANLVHWASIYEKLTGDDLMSYGQTAAFDPDDDPSVTLSEPTEPIDLAWAILKGL